MTPGMISGLGGGRFLAAVAAAFALGHMGTAALQVAAGEPRLRSSGLMSPFHPLVGNPDDPNQPLLRDGSLVTLKQAEESAGIPIYRPDDPAASDDSLIQVWFVDVDGPEVALRYKSGLRAYLTVRPPGRPGGEQNAASFYRNQALVSGVGSFEHINGHPAYVVAEDAQAEGWPRNSVVDLTIGNVDISLHAHLPLERLIRLAASVR